MNYKVPKEIMGGVDCMFVVNWCESRYDGYSLHFDLKEREAKDNVRPPNGKGLILNPDIEKGRFHIQYSKELRNFLQDHPAKANIK